ncbi:MAG TPA: hypothetical protein VMM93_01510 [Vicinamibacterales bacterium]|nr:hypothetical protein [Vicinamibacterales bacterium]
MLPAMGSKAEQLQIRVTAAQKAALRRQARRAGLGMSAFVLARALPAPRQRFAELVQALVGDDRRFALAELNDLLSSLTARELRAAVEEGEVDALSPLDRNYVAALVELACDRKGLAPPEWVGRIEPLAAPHFAAPFPSLRPHLLRSAPVPFKRRNIFVDSAVGDRV